MPTVLAGSAKRVVGAAYWHDYHLLVYETTFGDIVVLNDSQILHIISPSLANGRPMDASLTVSFNPHTAAIAVADSAKITVYECVEMFGKLPTWRAGTELNTGGDPIESLAWLDADILALADSRGENSVWNVREQISLWNDHIGHRMLAAWSQNALVSFDPESPVLIMITLDFSGSRAVLQNFQSAYLGESRIESAWTINPEILVIQNSSAKFLYRIDTKCRWDPQLCASIPRSSGIVGGDDVESVLISTKSGISKLNYLSLPLSLERISDTTGWGDSDFATTNATVQRMYLINPNQGVIEIYDRTRNRTVCRISGASKPSSSTSLTANSELILAGNSLFQKSDSQLIGGACDEHAVHTALVSTTKFLVTTAQTLSLYENLDGINELVWSQPLAQFPMLVGVVGTDKLAVVFSNSIVWYHVQSGTSYLTSKVPFTVQSAAISSEMIVVASDNRLQAMTSDGKATAQFNSSEKILAVSACQNLVSLYTGAQITLLTHHHEKLSLVCELPLPKAIDGLSVRMLACNTLVLGVIIGHKISIYAQINRIDTQLVFISETEIDPIPLRRGQLSWLSDEQIAYFNGKQLLIQNVRGVSESISQINQTFAMHLPPMLTLVEIVKYLNEPVPIYHPKALLLIFQALRPQLVGGILKTLGSQIPFANIEEGSGMELIQIDKNLGYSSLSEITESSVFSGLSFNPRYRLAGLTANEQSTLQKLSDLYAQGTLQDLDPLAICALVLSKAYSSPPYASWSYAWLSQTQPELLNRFNALSTPHPFHVWLENSALASELEKLARKEFAQSRDPPDVSLYYLALHKLDTLKTLWRISGGHPEREKTLKLIANDFTTPRWRTAAQKNAYALMSRKRYLYAAAFFLLGHSIKDCCQVIMAKLHNVDLAIAVSRVYDGDSSPGLEYIINRLETTSDGNANDAQWTQFFLLLVLNQPKRALECIDIGPLTVFMYAQQGGTVTTESKKRWVQQLSDAGLPSIVHPLVESLAPVHLPDPESAPAAASKSTVAAPPVVEDEWKPPPAHLKPPPADIPLEPDMSAFGF